MKIITVVALKGGVGKTTLCKNIAYKLALENKDRFLIAEYIYKEKDHIFDSYDYVLIDYPPTINDLALNFLILSDLIIIPVNDGLGSFKGLIDLKNTLNYICQKEQRKIGKILITLNNIKSDNNTQQINNWIYENQFTELLAKSIIKHSKSFINTENDLSSIWTNPYYWRQKQAYEELIAEII